MKIKEMKAVHEQLDGIRQGMGGKISEDKLNEMFDRMQAQFEKLNGTKSRTTVISKWKNISILTMVLPMVAALGLYAGREQDLICKLFSAMGMPCEEYSYT